MNRWQKLFINHYYNGKMPWDKRGLKQFELLGKIGSSVTVYFPKTDSKEAHSVTYEVRENECNMTHEGGTISAVVLSWQILTWDKCGYKIETDTEVEKSA